MDRISCMCKQPVRKSEPRRLCSVSFARRAKGRAGPTTTRAKEQQGFLRPAAPRCHARAASQSASLQLSLPPPPLPNPHSSLTPCQQLSTPSTSLLSVDPPQCDCPTWSTMSAAPPAESERLPPPASLPATLACASAEREAGVPPDLIAFRAREGKVAREKKLRELWELLPLKDSVRAAPGPNPETGGWVGNSIFGPSVYRPPAASDGSTSSKPANSPRQAVRDAGPPSTSASSASDRSAALFAAIDPPPPPSSPSTLSPERADALRAMYQEELVRRCANPHAPDARQFAGEVRSPEDAVGKGKEKVVDWKGFRTYLWEREAGASAFIQQVAPGRP